MIVDLELMCKTMRQFTRLINGFSKTLGNLKAAVPRIITFAAFTAHEE